MTPTQVLRVAAAHLATPGAWTQGAFARDAEGRPTTANDHGAVCWCAVGAIIMACGPHAMEWRGGWTPSHLLNDAHDAFGSVVPKRYATRPGKWADRPGRTVEEVCAKLLEAARKLEGRP